MATLKKENQPNLLEKIIEERNRWNEQNPIVRTEYYAVDQVTRSYTNEFDYGVEVVVKDNVFAGPFDTELDALAELQRWENFDGEPAIMTKELRKVTYIHNLWSSTTKVVDSV